MKTIAVLVVFILGAAAPGAGAIYPPDTCLQGYVWREAFPGDRVCVPPAVRAQAQDDNRHAAARREAPSGACRSGYVARDAGAGDAVCVAPEVRAQAAADNAAATRRRVGSPAEQIAAGERCERDSARAARPAHCRLAQGRTEGAGRTVSR